MQTMDLTGTLLAWYDKNRRDLPWRNTREPYFIWLSEIIMQQTRVEQGTPYYERFVAKYPDILKLALADEQEVLHLWQGLGYYSRARNLHRTAQDIVARFGGRFPEKYPDIRGLNGVGDYTAAAIASICFGQPYPVVDGNVLRLFSRYFGIETSVDLPATRKNILGFAESHIDHQRPGDFNQAVMEYGALVCVPVRPKCEECALRSGCKAFELQKVTEIPVRRAKTIVKPRYLSYLVLTVTRDQSVYLLVNQRTGSDIWKNLYDFPLAEHGKTGFQDGPESPFVHLSHRLNATFIGVSSTYRHLLSHQKLFVRFYRYHTDQQPDIAGRLIPVSELSSWPVPRLIQRYLQENSMSPIFLNKTAGFLFR